MPDEDPDTGPAGAQALASEGSADPGLPPEALGSAATVSGEADGANGDRTGDGHGSAALPPPPRLREALAAVSRETPGPSNTGPASGPAFARDAARRGSLAGGAVIDGAVMDAAVAARPAVTSAVIVAPPVPLQAGPPPTGSAGAGSAAASSAASTAAASTAAGGAAAGGGPVADPGHRREVVVTGDAAGERAEDATESAAGRHRGVPGARPATAGAADDGSGESEDDVAIPAGPNGSADTPIARAAQAAVVARSGGLQWPRPRSCRILTVANQKGGVGKTTTAVNLAASLAMHGARVLVVDLDPQGNASTALDVDHHSGVGSVYNVLVEGQPLGSVVCRVSGFPQLYCAPATIDLAGAEIELVPMVARESRLARAVAEYDASELDYILIDCPPSLGLLTVNALVAAPEVLIPIQCEYYALEGLEQLLRTVELVKSHLNPHLAVTTILLTMYDGRTRLASQVADEVRQHFGDVVLGSVIPRSVRVSEAPSYGQSVMTYDPGSSGAQAYLEAARELAYRAGQLAAS
jgi:chromosome partitioning protein